MGKVEDYTVDQLERIAKKLVELARGNIKSLFGGSFHELGRYNYGYALVVVFYDVTTLYFDSNIGRYRQNGCLHGMILLN